jgi:hypothetical protein
MDTRNVFSLCLAQALVAILTSAQSFGGEYTPKQWDKHKAAEFLDRRGEDWFNFGAAHRGKGASKTACISCHSLLSYAVARPVLRQLSSEHSPTKYETRILEQIKRRVANWDRLDTPEFQLYYDFDDAKKKQSRGTEAILNSLILALDDRLQGRAQPSDDTKKALTILWSTQITEGQDKGSWDWLNFGTEPWEADGGRYMGAALAAIAAGSAPGDHSSSADGTTHERRESLRAYLKKHFSVQNLHNRIWMLWATATMDGLLTQSEKDQLIDQIVAKQQPNGGWSVGSLGNFTRGNLKNAAKDADGYATGLIIHVLQLAGLPKENPHVGEGVAWLRENQDPTGAWRATSVNKIRAPESTDPAKAHIGKFMWDAATAYSILALSH